MEYFRLFDRDCGDSTFEDVTITLSEKTFAPPARAIEISETRASSRMLFLRLRKGWNEPIHPTPIPQTLICRQGTVRVTASDGSTREVGPGDVWLMEDCAGKGHHTEVISAEDFECVIVQHG